MPILGVINHFRYYERVLKFAKLHGAHTGENMEDLLDSRLEGLGIGHKILTITADNATNNKSIVSKL